MPGSAGGNGGHNWTKNKNSDTVDAADSSQEEEENPFDKFISKSGCASLHYAVQDCMAEHQDWRKCQVPLKQFRDCIQNSKHTPESVGVAK